MITQITLVVFYGLGLKLFLISVFKILKKVAFANILLNILNEKGAQPTGHEAGRNEDLAIGGSMKS